MYCVHFNSKLLLINYGGLVQLHECVTPTNVRAHCDGNEIKPKMYYSTQPTFNVFTYFWHKNLAANTFHSTDYLGPYLDKN
jgi:hypothetical protein